MNATTARLLSALALTFLTCQLASAADPTISADVVYGRKDGMALTLDVIRPAKANGGAILWIPTGGWYSPWFDAKFSAGVSKPMLDKGYTVVVVRHGCAPKYAIPECAADVRRGVRFVRLKAKEFGIDPGRIGVWGASAGGHLSLVLGTTGDDGDKKAKDEVLRQSSRVAAVVALCPPTDIREWVTNPPEIIRKFAALKPPLTFDAKLAPDLSPLVKVTAKSAPTLFVHGDKDELVPIDHSKKMLAALEKEKVACRLLTMEGAGHAFSQKQNAEVVLPAMLDWFEKHLCKKE
jgi:acetyl esterase/lipase